MAYEGIFLRHYLGQLPDQNNSGSGWTASPDIIPYSVNNIPQPAPSPDIFTSQAGYANAFGSTIFLKQNNFIYVRGLNTTNGPITARLWFYYVESNMVLWPQNWQSASVYVNGNLQNYMEVSAKTQNEIIVGNPPFIWNAPSLQSGNDHYCMIAFAENPPLSQPPQSPAPSGYMNSWDDLAQYVISHPNMAWRNTIDVSVDNPTWQQIAPIAGAPAGGTFNIGIQCSNMPTDGYFAFDVPGPDAANSIHVPKTPITNPNTGLTIPVTWPPNFSSSISVSYWMGATKPPYGATLQPIIIVPYSGMALRMPELLLNAPQRRSNGLFRFGQPHRIFAYDSPKMLNGSVIHAYIVGSMPYRFVS